MEDDSEAYIDGGMVDAGTVFVVTRVAYFGSARGDSNGHGELKLVVGGEGLVNETDSEEDIQGVWTGHIEIPPGEETRTYLEVADSSTADVVLDGYFRP